MPKSRARVKGRMRRKPRRGGGALRHKRRGGHKIVSLCRTLQPRAVFPRELRTTLSAHVELELGKTNVQHAYSFLGNSLGSGTTLPYQGIGPQVDYAGNFQAVYTTGAAYLLSTPLPTGSGSVYSLYRVLASRLTCRVYPDSFFETAAGGGIFPSSVIRFTCFPSQNPSFLNMPFDDVCEQPGATVKEVPNPMTLAGPIATATSKWIADTTEVYQIKRIAKTHKVFGITKGAVNTITDFAGSYLGGPVRPWFWHIMLDADSTAVPGQYAATVEVRIDYDIVFFELNPLISVRNV